MTAAEYDDDLTPAALCENCGQPFESHAVEQLPADRRRYRCPDGCTEPSARLRSPS